MSSVYPWQQTYWQHFYQLNKTDKLAHAILLSGAPGLGKAKFAERLSQLLLCEKQSVCGDCQSCQLNLAATHPDKMLVQSEEGSKTIKIDQIRQVLNCVLHKPMIAKRRVVVIEHIENLTNEAANCLLKTLEEPVGNAVLIVTTDHYSLLSATIRSRCQNYCFTCPDRMLSIEWLSNNTTASREHVEVALSLAKQSPLDAKQLLDDDLLELRYQWWQKVLALTRQELDFSVFSSWFVKQNINGLMGFWLSVVEDLQCLFNGTCSNNQLINRDFSSDLQRLSKYINYTKLYQFWQCLLNGLVAINYNPSANNLLMIEKLQVDWLNLIEVKR